MFDPAAMGTLLIGVELGTQTDTSHRRRRRPIVTPRRTHALRLALARRLRRIAAALERPMVGEVAR